MPTSPLPPELAEEYPFALRSLDLDGLRYSYVDEGSGETLLFVHGNPTWSFAWRNLVKDLSTGAGLPESAAPPAEGDSGRERYRCIAVDHIGMGLSEKPRENGAQSPYRVGRHIENLKRLIEALDLREITLIGHDWGGCIGMGAAVQMPERFQRFVMMNTAAFRSRQIPLRIAACRIPVLGAVGVRGLNLFSRVALMMAVEKPLPDVVRRGYLFPYDSWRHRIGVHRFVQEIPLKPSHPSYQTLVQVEQGLEQFEGHPLLLIWGEKDWCFTTAFLDEWERRFPQARTLRLPDAGHYVFEDAPERILLHMREFFKG